MNDASSKPTGLYSLEIKAPDQAGGTYQWVIRLRGKLFQRSDRGMPTEAKAREKGEEIVERLLREG